MRRAFVALSVGVAVLLVSAGIASATHSEGTGPAMDLVVGTGEIQTPPIVVKLHVNATSGPAGENPTGHAHFAGNPPPIGALEFQARVTCLNVVGNRATVGLVITHSMEGPIPEGFGGLFSVTDGGDLSPDAFEGFPVFPPPVFCPPPLGGRQISEGNFIVHDATP